MTEHCIHSRQQDLAAILRGGRHWPVRDLAARFECSDRTINRDLAIFADALGQPVPRDRAGYYLEPMMFPETPLQLTLDEARALHFGLRLLLRHSAAADPHALNLIRKLAPSFTGLLGRHALETVRRFEQLPADPTRGAILHRLTDALNRRRTVTIRYAAPEKRVRDFIFDPWVLEPGQANSAAYTIGYSHTHGEVRTLAVDRMRACEVSDRTFLEPDLSAICEQAEASWSGIVANGGEAHEVVIDFAKSVASRVRESPWHATRSFEDLPGGGVRLRLRLPALFDFVPWVLQWGSAAHVVAPVELKKRVMRELLGAARTYADHAEQPAPAGCAPVAEAEPAPALA